MNVYDINKSLLLKYTTIILAGCFLIFNMISCTNEKVIKLIPVKIGEMYGYIDREGRTVVNPQFREASVFRDGIALVKSLGDNPKWGYIDETGKYIINPQYKNATIFSEGLAWVVMENGAPTAINKKGEILFTLKDAQNAYIFSEGLAAYTILDKDGKIKAGFVDKKGKVIINPQFYGEGRFREGLCTVANSKEKWGYIDKTGRIVIDYLYDETTEFINGVSTVKVGEKWGVINSKGKYLINPKYDKLMQDDVKTFCAMQKGKWGWINEKGKVIINPQFKNVSFFRKSDYAPVLVNKQWGYINKKGDIVINPQFEGSMPFDGDIAVVSNFDNKVGFINRDGNYIINLQFNDISEDYILCTNEDYTAFGVIKTDVPDVDNFKFDSYPAEITNMTTRAQLNLLSNPNGKLYKSQIVEQYNNKKIDFGGHYITVCWGAGAGLTLGVMVDVLTGIIYNLPLTEENSYRDCYYNDNKNIFYQPNSNLFVTFSNLAVNETDKIELNIYYYKWDGAKFNLIGRKEEMVTN